ncbi:hypothetical protein HAHI6034_11385 [Hathewaya histolytica]|uniref:Uncharacterized protein n=1 Tax=Hathewaya histolytica TaxID=1498 RepID=A0A4U9R9M3_HATHI|nr:Uncharacterised protein [Hathewaya histolytica]
MINNKEEFLKFLKSILKSFIILYFFLGILPGAIKIYGEKYLIRKYSAGNSIFVCNEFRERLNFFYYFYLIIKKFLNY